MTAVSVVSLLVKQKKKEKKREKENKNKKVTAACPGHVLCNSSLCFNVPVTM